MSAAPVGQRPTSRPRPGLPCVAAVTIAASLILFAPLLARAASGIAHPAVLSPLDRLLRRGEYDAAIKRAPRVEAPRQARDARGSRANRTRTRGIIVAARAEVALGRIQAARERLEQATVYAPDDLPLRAELMLVANAMGDRTSVRALQDLFAEAALDENAEGTHPTDLIALAHVARLENDYKRANRLLRAAVRVSDRDPEANIIWGWLFLEKNALSSAETSFAHALAFDAENPDALVGMARLHLDRDYDRESASAALEHALTVNPRHAGALEMLGEMALDAEAFGEVDRIASKLRTTNPDDAGAHWLLAARAFIESRTADYERERDAHLRTHPGDGDFFARIAESLVRQRRYSDAHTVASACVKMAPQHAQCLGTLGTTMLRQADETNGLALLRRAFAADPYNERTFNQLELFERTIAERYVVETTKHFRFRIEPSMRTVLHTLIAPFLEQTYAYYAKRYRYEPPLPITIELYGNAADYSIRTVGLPHLGVAAVCFGRVITAQAPGEVSLNWGMILAHELGHTFAIGLSRERVPRWFTEGLSEVETAHLRSEWSRHDHLALYGALQLGQLPPLSRLSQAFLAARNADQALTAYMYATTAVAFLEEKFGFDGIRKALVEFGKNVTPVQVLSSVTSSDGPALDQMFAASLEQRYAYLSEQFLPTVTDRLPREVADEKARARGAGAADLARAGLAALEDGDVAQAARWLVSARAKTSTGATRTKARPKTKKTSDGAQDPLVAYLGAMIADRRGDAEAVQVLLEPLLQQGIDGYDLRVQLGLNAVRGGDFAAAEVHLLRAVELAPEAMQAWAMLAQLYRRSGDAQKELHALRQAFELDPQSRRLSKDLLETAAKLQAHETIAQAATMMAFIDPSDANLHALHGRALMQLGRHREAIAPLQWGLALGYQPPAELHRDLAQVFNALGETANARAHEAQADPSPLKSPRVPEQPVVKPPPAPSPPKPSPSPARSPAPSQ